MGVRLTPEEIDDYLTKSHTLIVSSIRKSGEPLTIPLWYVYQDGSFFARTQANSKRVQHIRRDPRVCCLVEDGEKWIDLRAVIANCDAEIIEDEALVKAYSEAIDQKYKEFTTRQSKMPGASQKHYATKRIIIKMTPREGKFRTWYNRKLRMPS